jgi:hypothetical protein
MSEHRRVWFSDSPAEPWANLSEWLDFRSARSWFHYPVLTFAWWRLYRAARKGRP